MSHAAAGNTCFVFFLWYASSLRIAGRGVRTLYAHLSRIDVTVGEWISGGTVIGQVGATGDATGPHLHFEVHINGAAINPLRALVPLPTGA